MYKVEEHIEVDYGNGENCRNKQIQFTTENQAIYYVKHTMENICKKNVNSRFQKYKIDYRKYDACVIDELRDAIEDCSETDRGYYCYVADMLGWNCHWHIKEQ